MIDYSLLLLIIHCLYLLVPRSRSFSNLPVNSLVFCCGINLTSFHSGTTWVQEVVWQIFNEGQVKSTYFRERVPFLEWATHPLAEHPDINTLPSPRILKTHLPYNTVPKIANEDSKCKYIYVARNPKDVAVSYFKFVTSLAERCKGPWEFYIKLFLEGNGKFIYVFSPKRHV